MRPATRLRALSFVVRGEAGGIGGLRLMSCFDRRKT